MGPHRHRAHPRPAAAVGDAEGFVQVQVGHVRPEAAGLSQTDQSVEVGTIDINLAPVAVHQVTQGHNARLEHPVGGGVGDHGGRQPGLVRFGLDRQIMQIHVAVGVARHHHHRHPGHDR